jgi:antitoxin component of MazEF toxin-antitoxin module
MGVSVDYDREEVSATRSVFKSGGSHVVSIPPEILKEAGFGPDDDVDVVHRRGEDSVEIRLVSDEDE